jgi:CRP-like cAMP-binding protein
MASTSDLDVFAELRSLPGLAELPREVVLDLAAAASQRREHAGSPLVHQGKVSPAFAILARGAAKITRSPLSAPEEEIVVGVLRGPTIVPDPSALDGVPSSVSMVTLRSSQIISVDVRAFTRLSNQHPGLTRAVAARHAIEARAHARHLEELVVGSVEERLRRLLDRLSAEHGTPLGQGRFIAIPLRRRDIASLVNATTETVSRLLAKLERDGAARSTRDGIWWRSVPKPSPSLPRIGDAEPPSGPMPSPVPAKVNDASG